MSSVYELPASLRPRLRRCMSMGSEGGNGNWTVGKLKKCKSFPATRDTESSNFSIQAKIKKFKTLKGLSSTNAPSTADRVLGGETVLYYTPVGIVSVMVLLGLLHFFHVIG